MKNYETNLARMAGLNGSHWGVIGMVRLYVLMMPYATIGELTRKCQSLYPDEVMPIHPGLAFVSKITIGRYLSECSPYAGAELDGHLHDSKAALPDI